MNTINSKLLLYQGDWGKNWRKKNEKRQVSVGSLVDDRLL
jgi:hypothetical protein